MLGCEDPTSTTQGLSMSRPAQAWGGSGQPVRELMVGKKLMSLAFTPALSPGHPIWVKGPSLHLMLLCLACCLPHLLRGPVHLRLHRVFCQQLAPNGWVTLRVLEKRGWEADGDVPGQVEWCRVVRKEWTLLGNRTVGRKSRSLVLCSTGTVMGPR
jgi:hypothetical protein